MYLCGRTGDSCASENLGLLILCEEINNMFSKTSNNNFAGLVLFYIMWLLTGNKGTFEIILILENS